MWTTWDTFDLAVSQWVNQLARSSQILDSIVVGIVELQILRTAVMVALMCWAYWTAHRQVIDEDLIWPRIALGLLVAIAASRALQNGLPARLRPLHEPELAFVPPFGVA